MYNPKTEEVSKMFHGLVSKHKDEISSAYLDWEIMEIYNPHIEGIIYQPVPVVVLDFKW